MKTLRSLILLYAVTLSFIFQSVSFAEPNNLSLLKEKVKTYYDSGEYNAELSKIAFDATRYIDMRANKNAHSSKPQKLALVLDIDETSFSNFTNIRDFDFAGTSDVLKISYSDTHKPPIEPILSLYKNAKQHGINIFFVTGRPEVYKESTINSLKNAGYSNWNAIYFKPMSYNQSSIVPFKSHIREELTKQGYTIIASIGDQWSDIQGGYADRGFKLPNPYYFVK